MIPYLDYAELNKNYFVKFEESFSDFLRSGWYILGDSVKDFENNFSSYTGTNYCIGVSSGLSALELSVRVLMENGILQEGDGVLIASNTYIATALAPLKYKLSIHTVDPCFENYNVGLKEYKSFDSWDKIKLVIHVHLFGYCSLSRETINFLRSKNVRILEDCAQSHGARNKDGLISGSLGDLAAWSFYPGKNLGALGDAGAITTNNQKFSEQLRSLRNYGSQKKYFNEFIGDNARLDEVQAGFLNIKLGYLEEITRKRRKIARRYLSEIVNPRVKMMNIAHNESVWHIFPIEVDDRECLKNYLSSNEIGYQVHYPIPLAMQECLSYLEMDTSNELLQSADRIISIPLNESMSDHQICQVISVINNYEG